MDGILDLERIAKIIIEANPDIVALQEVDINTVRNGNVDQLNKLAELTGMSGVFGKSMDWDGGEYGNAVLSKLPIKSHKIYPLPGEPRSALAVTVSNKKGDDFVFISTHLDTQEEFRIASIPYLKEIFAESSTLPLILAGDYNAEPGSELMQFIGDHLFNATENLPTIPVDEPNLQIDYITYGPKDAWQVISSKVLEEKIASDHRPIVTKLILN